MDDWFCKKCFFTSILILLLYSCAEAQPLPKDQMEYGFRGGVRSVVKITYPDLAESDEKFMLTDSNWLTRHTYYFNEKGNIDSTRTERKKSPWDVNAYKTIYESENNQKKGWVAYSNDTDIISYATILWKSDKEFTEEVYNINNNRVGARGTTILNDSFRTKEIKIKTFDGDGNVIQESIQKFEHDRQQNTLSYQMSDLLNGSITITDYEYLSFDTKQNPTKLLLHKRDTQQKALTTLSFSYYD